MLIDLHTHTTVSSGCSTMSPEGLIHSARSRGLDAVCVTDHYAIEGADVTQALGRQMGYPVFRGVEARTDLGDMLVFGYYRDIAPGIPLEDLCSLVHEVGGLVFAAHPFHRGGGPSLALRLRQRGFDPRTDWSQLGVLDGLDGVETCNARVSAEDNRRARRLADRLGVPEIGGSDAHAVDTVGNAATRFPGPVSTDAGLVAALRDGGYKPVRQQLRGRRDYADDGGTPVDGTG